MLSSLKAYKAFFIYSLLVSYVAGAFHMPALEALHAVAHVVEHLLQPPRHHHLHTHHDHAEKLQHHDHAHPGISILSQTLDRTAENEDHPARQHTDGPEKKKPELLQPARTVVTFDSPCSVKPELYFFALHSFIPPIPELPPEG